MWMFHFADNSSPSTSRLAKLDFKISKTSNCECKLIHNFQTVYPWESELVVDETMVLFHGRVKFCQYIPGKSHIYGYKFFKLCTVDGYTWKFEAYCGV